MILNVAVGVCLFFVGATLVTNAEKFEFTSRRNTRETTLQKEHLCPPLTVLHGHVRCVFNHSAVSCGAPMRPGTTAVPGCKPNYRADMSTHSEIICLDNGRWSHHIFNCIPACGESKEPIEVTQTIIKGKNATIGLFPWHAGIYHRLENKDKSSWQQQCGGSLITDLFVLTAAHCVYEMKKEDVRVALGKYHRSWEANEITEQKFNVSQIFMPREFFRARLTCDLALIQLDRRVEFGGAIMPVCHGFIEESSNIMEKNLFVVGWGLTEESNRGSSSETLLYNSDNRLETDNECRDVAPAVLSTAEKLCTSNNSSDVAVAQPGDSGGGLTVVDDGLHYIVGIMSFRVKDKKYSFATNLLLRRHKIWIEDHIKQTDSFFSWDNNQKKVLNYTLGEKCKQEGDIFWSCVELKDCVTEARNIYMGIYPDSCLLTGNKVTVCCRPPERKSIKKCQEYGSKLHGNGRVSFTEIGSCAYTETTNGSMPGYLFLENPHMAVIGYVDNGLFIWTTSGSLISERYILSTADRSDFGIRRHHAIIGYYNKYSFHDPRQVLYPIIDVIIHPDYSGYANDFANNIALYKLKDNVIINFLVRPICLHTEDMPNNGYATLTGWQLGVPGIDKTFKKENVSFVNTNQCLQYNEQYQNYPNFSKYFLCATSHQRSYCTFGISLWGSALQIRLKKHFCMYSLVAISNGIPCGNKPGVFTKMSHYVPWIESIVWP